MTYVHRYRTGEDVLAGDVVEDAGEKSSPPTAPMGTNGTLSSGRHTVA